MFARLASSLMSTASALIENLRFNSFMTSVAHLDGIDSMTRAAVAAGSIEMAAEGWKTLLRSNSSRPHDDVLQLIVELAVFYRDSGQVERALSVLLGMWQVYKDRSVCLEILVILSNVERDDNFRIQFINTIPENIRNDEHIAFFVSRLTQLSGNTADALRMLGNVDKAAVDAIPSFKMLRAKMVESLAKDVASQLEIIGNILKMPNAANMAADICDTAIVNGILEIDDRAAFEAGVRRVAFTHREFRGLTRIELCERLTAVLDTGNEGKIAIVLRFLLACKQNDMAISLARLAFDRCISNCDYVKSLVKLTEVVEDAELYERSSTALNAVLNSVPVPESEAPDDRARRMETIARALTNENAAAERYHDFGVLPPNRKRVETARTPHIFIGLFGQLRFPRVLLPRIKSMIDAQFGDFVLAGGVITMGVSTWEKVGSRILSPDDDFVFIAELLPNELVRGLTSLNARSVREVISMVPNVANLCLSSNEEQRDVTSEFLTENLGEKILIDIGTETDFMRHAGNAAALRFGGDSNMLNQARMWNRIACLEPLIFAAEEKTGLAVSHAFLLRTDLNFFSAPFGSFFPLKQYGNNFLIADDDAHANFIEGLGDRYMLGDRRAINRILEGERLMQTVLSSGSSIDPSYITKLGAHRFLETILFEHGTTIKRTSQEKINFEIYRGKLTMLQIAQALQRDIDITPEGQLKEFLRTLL